MLALILALALLISPAPAPLALSVALVPDAPQAGEAFAVVLTLTNAADVPQATRLHGDTIGGVDIVMAVIVPAHASTVLTFTETLPTDVGTYTLCYGAGASVIGVSLGVGYRVFIPGVTTHA